MSNTLYFSFKAGKHIGRDTRRRENARPEIHPYIEAQFLQRGNISQRINALCARNCKCTKLPALKQWKRRAWIR